MDRGEIVKNAKIILMVLAILFFLTACKGRDESEGKIAYLRITNNNGETQNTEFITNSQKITQINKILESVEWTGSKEMSEKQNPNITFWSDSSHRKPGVKYTYWIKSNSGVLFSENPKEGFGKLTNEENRELESIFNSPE